MTELLDDIRAQTIEAIRELSEAMDEVRLACEQEEELTEDLEDRIKTHAANLIAATGAYRALDEAAADEEDEE